MEITVRFIEIDGVCTPVHDTGGDDPHAVVFVHGNPGSGEDWQLLMSVVAPFSRAIAPDMPGFARADKPTDFNYTVSGYAAHLEKILERLGITRVHLVLHDFGGPWGLAWAAANTAKIASLTLFNIGVMRGYRWHYLARIWRTPILGEIFQALTTRAGFALLLKRGNPRGLPKWYVDRMYRHYDSGTRRAILRLYRATNDLTGDAEALMAALKPLDLTTLVIWGKCDPYLAHTFGEQQKETFPRAKIVYFEDSGHWPFIDNPHATEAVLIPFLKRCVSEETVS